MISRVPAPAAAEGEEEAEPDKPRSPGSPIHRHMSASPEEAQGEAVVEAVAVLRPEPPHRTCR